MRLIIFYGQYKMRDSEHHLFYSDNITGNIVQLDNNESNHALAVLSVKSGQRIQITDGSGAIYECQCTNQKPPLSCEILKKTIVPKITPELTLLVGIPYKENFEIILEHATALGVARIVPLVMEHCRKPWWESWDKQRQRFASKMVVSMKQCLYPYIPRLDAPTSLEKILDTCEKPLIVAEQNGKVLRDEDISHHKKLSCLIGPPGGLSNNELTIIESYRQQNANSILTVKIAPSRLRTELAATVLCSRIIGAFL